MGIKRKTRLPGARPSREELWDRASFECSAKKSQLATQARCASCSRGIEVRRMHHIAYTLTRRPQRSAVQTGIEVID
jgi:hypothetical protein